MMLPVTTWLQRRSNLKGASIFRALVGSILLYQMLINYAQRGFLYGPHGILASQTSLGQRSYDATLFGLSEAPWHFEVSYHASLAALLFWTAGHAVKWLTPPVWWIVYSLSQSNGYIQDGGDNLILILLAYGCVMDLSEEPRWRDHLGRLSVAPCCMPPRPRSLWTTQTAPAAASLNPRPAPPASAGNRPHTHK